MRTATQVRVRISDSASSTTMVGRRASTSTAVAAARFRARLAGERAIEGGQARPFGAALATCRQPRRRGCGPGVRRRRAPARPASTP